MIVNSEIKEHERRIIDATLASIKSYIKANFDMILSDEAMKEIDAFIVSNAEEEGVEGGIRFLITRNPFSEENDLTTSVTFEAKVYTILEKEELYKEFTLVYKKNKKLDDKANLILIKMANSQKERLRKFCKKRGIPHAKVLLEVVDPNRSLRISIYNNRDLFSRVNNGITLAEGVCYNKELNSIYLFDEGVKDTVWLVFSPD